MPNIKVLTNRLGSPPNLSFQALCELHRRAPDLFTSEDDDYYCESEYKPLSATTIILGNKVLYLDTKNTVVRCDKRLIKLVEALGDGAHGRKTFLHIIEVPDGEEWTVETIRGVEVVVGVERVWR